jgi:hypothetical protein
VLVPLIVVSLVVVALVAALVAVISRPSPVSQRERLLERDIIRLQRERDAAFDKLLHVVERPWTLPPAALEQQTHEPEDDEPDFFVQHDELNDDTIFVPPMYDRFEAAGPAVSV